MSYFKDVFVSIDQLGNTLAGGDPDNTISARIGYYNYYSEGQGDIKWYWRWFRAIVDFTFRPVDGEEHCHEAYHNDAGEKFDNKTKNWAVAILAIFIILSCVLIAIFLYIFWLFRLVSPKKIDRYKNITQRLTEAKAKLSGAINEIDHHPITADAALKQLSQDTIDKATALHQLL